MKTWDKVKVMGLRFFQFLREIILVSGKTDREISNELLQRGHKIHHTTLWRWQQKPLKPNIENLRILHALPEILEIDNQRLIIYRRFLGQLIQGKEKLRTDNLLNYRKNFIGGQMTFFVGRELEINLLQNAIRKRRNIFISGLGGVGKTSLAWKLMEDNVQNYQYGYDSIQISKEQTPISVVAHVAQNLNVPISLKQSSHNLNEALEYLTSWAYDVSMLFLLDNVYSIEQIEDLIGRFPSITWIVTSRKNLFSTKVNFEYFNLDPPLPEDAAKIAMYYSNANNNLQTQELATQISKRLNYLPIALKVAGAMVATGYVQNLANLLEWIDKQGIQVLHIDGWEIFSFFDNLLKQINSETVLKIFTICGVFEKPEIDMNIFGAMLQKLGLQNYEIGQLAKLHIITWLQDGLTFKLHPLLHEFATHKLASHPDNEKIHNKFMTCYSKLATTLMEDMDQIHNQYNNEGNAGVIGAKA